jgi:type VII secretion protein EccB
MTMQSRRDLFQAHRLMTQRASLALLRGEPDIPDQPLRRLNVSAFSGVLVAVIVTGLFFIWGLLGHGGSSLTDQAGLLVIDKQTGQPYVFCKQSGRAELCPAVNYASARLALGDSPLNQQTVDQSALTKFSRGPLIGIPGLPQPLPTSGLLVRQPWSVCTRTALGLSGLRTTTVLAGGISVGGQPLADGALLVQAFGQDQDWVIWNGQRMAIQQIMVTALSSQQPIPVPSVWLNAVPEGPAFAPPAITGKGTTVTGPAGGLARVGQVYQVAVAGGTQYYVMLRDGLAQITPTQARLLDFELGAPSMATLSDSLVSGHQSATRVPGGGLPSSVPAVVAPGAYAPLCVVYAGGTSLSRQVETGGRMPSGGAATGVPADVDQVTLPPGAGALVGSDPGTGPDSGVISYFLIAGGRRYALAETEVAGMLGYSLSQAVLLPAGVVDLIPAGPPLDPAQAALPVPAG